jgi:hypothetical protein
MHKKLLLFPVTIIFSMFHIHFISQYHTLVKSAVNNFQRLKIFTLFFPDAWRNTEDPTTAAAGVVRKRKGLQVSHTFPPPKCLLGPRFPPWE